LQWNRKKHDIANKKIRHLEEEVKKSNEKHIQELSSLKNDSNQQVEEWKSTNLQMKQVFDRKTSN